MKYGGATSTVSEALLKAAERVTFSGAAVGGAAGVGSDGASPPRPASGDTRPANVTVNIGGRPRTVGTNSQSDANTLVGIQRELESGSSTAA